MKNVFFIFVLFFTTAASQSLNVMTYNIRLNTALDGVNAWPNRKDMLVSQVLYHGVNLLGVQEALHNQMIDLQQRLPQFKYTGVGRDDGKENGEYSAIFYDSSQLQLLQSQTFWLSPTPAVPGKGWDADYPRVVTWGKFKYRKTGKLFFAFNTHFDHVGKVARRESAKLLLQKVQEIATTYPAIITGDFNSHPDDEPIMIITDSTGKFYLTDSKPVSRTPHYGPAGTFNNFTGKEVNEQPIDYIFLKGKWKINSHATLSQTWNGRFASDHFPVLANVGW